MKIVDKRCEKCEKVYEYELAEDNKECKCGGKLLRMYSTKPEIFKVGWYENFDLAPLYIDTKKQFQKEMDKRGLVRVF